MSRTFFDIFIYYQKLEWIAIVAILWYTQKIYGLDVLCIEVSIVREKTNESAENYLETILMLSERLPVVRSVDVANELDFKKSSVSIAMKNLREKNHITMTSAGYIYLTEEGRAIAEMIYERHKLLSKCLESLGVPKEIADRDACKIEHVISKESFDAIKNHINRD